MGYRRTGLDALLHEAFVLLDLVVYFTMDPEEEGPGGAGGKGLQGEGRRHPAVPVLGLTVPGGGFRSLLRGAQPGATPPALRWTGPERSTHPVANRMPAR